MCEQSKNIHNKKKPHTTLHTTHSAQRGTANRTAVRFYRTTRTNAEILISQQFAFVNISISRRRVGAEWKRLCAPVPGRVTFSGAPDA